MTTQLYTLSSNNFSNLFGTPELSKNILDATIIGQKTDDSEFLILSDTAYPELVLQASIPSGFVFTYCQQWGLTINDEVIYRVKKELRDKKVDSIIVTTASGKSFDGNRKALANLTSAYVVGAAAGITETLWTLADNTRVTVTLDDIKEAMKLSGLKQSELWAI